MKLYIARHTQTNYNVQQLCNADPSVDVHLTKEGIQQAERLAERLAKESFEIIYVSELPRTHETAGYINSYHEVPITVDSRLNDNATGYEGKPIKEYLGAFNTSSDKWREAFNDGESLEQARNRADGFLNDLRTREYSSVLVVTHGYIVEAVNGIINNLSFEEASRYQISQGDFKIYEI